MQVLARAFTLSETIIVQAPCDPAHTARVRISFPTAESSFASHPTVGCAILRASLTAPEGDFVTDLLRAEKAGLVPVTAIRIQGAAVPIAPGRIRVPELPPATN